MAKNVSEQPVAENATAENKPKTGKTYALARLRSDCMTLFGVTTSLFDGATSSLDSGKEYTVAEVKNHIKEWKDKGVK